MLRAVKLLFVSLMLTAVCFGTAQADSFTYTGDTFNNPSGTFNRPQENGTLSPLGTSVPYNVFQFTVTVGGQYSFLSTSLEPVNLDPFLVLYANAFNPLNPLTNFVIANDDFNGSRTQSGFTTTLSVGTSYFLVTTGKTGAPGVLFFDAGRFTNTISGPGSIAAGAPTSTVPEPATLMLLGTGLAGVVARVRQRRRAV
jgi:hypothetical protein